MRPSTSFALHIAQAAATADWTHAQICKAVLLDLPNWLSDERVSDLVDEILLKSATPYAPSPRRLLSIVRDCPGFWKIWEESEGRIRLDQKTLSAPEFRPLPVFAELDIPQMATLRELAHWLGLSLGELDWFAGRISHMRPSDKMACQHYYATVRKKTSGRLRIIEAPKTRLKKIQRQILHDILNLVPVHRQAHGFVAGRSAITAASHHAGETLVMTCDLAEFFPSIPARRIQGLFRCLGYPWLVANYLTGLTTSRIPLHFLQDIRLDPPRSILKQSAVLRVSSYVRRLFAPSPGLSGQQMQLYHHSHLPQGAPTSPMLANLAAYSLDCRLAGLAYRFEARYTRYADDLAFSGDREFASSSKRFLRHVNQIVKDEEFRLSVDKTRIMGAGDCQMVTGIVINQHVNFPRRDYDRLKAILHNCKKYGPAGQNTNNHPDFHAFLNGRINWVEQLNLRRGRKLRNLYDRIDWPR